MAQLSITAPSGLASAHDGTADGHLVELWLSLKTSSHTRRAYAAEAARFLAFVQKPLAWVTLTDLQAWAEPAGAGKSQARQPEPGAHRRQVAAVLRPGDRLPSFQCRRRRETPPSRDGLAQRILEESEVAKLIEAAPEGRNRVLLKLLYVSGVRVSEVCGLKWCDALPRTRKAGRSPSSAKAARPAPFCSSPKSWATTPLHPAAKPAVDPIFPSRKGGGHARCLPGPPHRLRRRPQSRP